DRTILYQAMLEVRAKDITVEGICEIEALLLEGLQMDKAETQQAALATALRWVSPTAIAQKRYSSQFLKALQSVVQKISAQATSDDLSAMSRALDSRLSSTSHVGQ